MTYVDWLVLFTYIVLIIAMSWWIGLRQRSQDDYYLGGRSMPSWQIGFSLMANQVSAISLVGAPAFIAVKGNGGLVWLQYEFAVPLAMILIIFILAPIYHKTRSVTIYEYLEKRFGGVTRLSVSAVFLLSRGLGSGVALLATAIVTSVCLEWPLWETIVLIGAVSIIYTTFGGIVADIYSDIIQLVILWVGSLISVLVLINLLGSNEIALLTTQQGRLNIYDFSATGLGDGKSFGFMPMLIGGLFLYVSYYGCDQSQAQRLLATARVEQAQKALMINGLFRFLLVSTYCVLGVMLIPFLLTHPDLASRLQDQPPDFLVPYFLIENMPKGILGVIIAGFFAASMSSIDSALNSLSAATYRDFLIKIFPTLERLTGGGKVMISRGLTVVWGMVATGFALRMAGGSETVLELVNKIGSAFYGPVLAVFLLGMLARRTSQKGAVGGLGAGVGLNIFLWLYFGESVSWMWWNVFGFLSSFAVGCVLSLVFPCRRPLPGLIVNLEVLRSGAQAKRYGLALLFAFIVMLLLSLVMEKLLAG